MNCCPFDFIQSTETLLQFLALIFLSPGSLLPFINISSVAGIEGNRGQANYSASKAGIIGLTKSVAKELGSRGICCNAIAPGLIETDMTDGMTENEEVLSHIPLARPGKPAEVAGLAAFLAESGYITGEVIRIDGGMTL